MYITFRNGDHVKVTCIKYIGRNRLQLRLDMPHNVGFDIVPVDEVLEISDKPNYTVVPQPGQSLHDKITQP